VGGIFLQYWNSHGGLAQQGYPISNEFMEQSALDGKTYKVQYFERAVFELHPENQPPNNVLLSQLGTFRYRAKYGALTAQLSGTGNQTSSPVALKAGLAVLRSVRANDGYYYIDLMDSAGNQIHTIASGSGPRDLSDAVNIPADGNYLLKVQAEAGWTVNISQPKASYAAPAANQKWSGHGYQATPLFSLNAGHAVFHAVNANDSTNAAFKATLFDQDGRHVGDIADASGAANVSTPIEIPANAVFIIQVQSEGDWTIEVQQ
jgi:hypothetical protein